MNPIQHAFARFTGVWRMHSGNAMDPDMAMRRWLPGAAILVLCVAAVAASGYLMQSFPDGDDIAEAVTPVIGPGAESSMARNRRRTPRCDECGVVESIRAVTVVGGAADAAPVRSKTTVGRTALPVGTVTTPQRKLEIVIRLQDGSTQTITDVDSAKWKQGERVKLISGLAQ